MYYKQKCVCVAHFWYFIPITIVATELIVWLPHDALTPRSVGLSLQDTSACNLNDYMHDAWRIVVLQAINFELFCDDFAIDTWSNECTLTAWKLSIRIKIDKYSEDSNVSQLRGFCAVWDPICHQTADHVLKTQCMLLVQFFVDVESPQNDFTLTTVSNGKSSSSKNHSYKIVTNAQNWTFIPNSLHVSDNCSDPFRRGHWLDCLFWLRTEDSSLFFRGRETFYNRSCRVICLCRSLTSGPNSVLRKWLNISSLLLYYCTLGW
jgi:hypothetical protein